MDEKRPNVLTKHYEQYIYQPNPDEDYQIDNPETAAKVMACIAYLNYENIRDEMDNNPTGWEDSEAVNFSSQWCTEEGMKFDMALIDYAGGNILYERSLSND